MQYFYSTNYIISHYKIICGYKKTNSSVIAHRFWVFFMDLPGAAWPDLLHAPFRGRYDATRENMSLFGATPARTGVEKCARIGPIVAKLGSGPLSGPSIISRRKTGPIF